jgi:pilus assembly protein CpaE
VANGSPQVDGKGLCLITVGLDAATVETARQAALQESVQRFTDLPDYLQSSANAQLARQLDGADGVVCLIDFDRSQDMAAQTAASVQPLAAGRATLMALSAEENPELILNAMRAGCTEYLQKPLQADQLASCLRKLRTRWLSTSSRSAPATGRVLGFLGARGGAGTTTIAVHLGTFLAKRQSRKTLIIDHHVQLGHVAMMLGMDAHEYSFLDLVGNIARLDLSLLKSYVAHHASGLDLLPSPDSLSREGAISADALERGLRFVAEVYDFVLIDCPHGIDETNQVIVRCCDELHLVATPEVPALRDLSRYLARLAELEVPAGKLKVIINRQDSQRTVSVDQIAQAIGHPVDLTLPSAAADLVRAVDMGQPISPDKKSEFGSQIRKWACALAPSEAVAPEVKRRFAFWS